MPTQTPIILSFLSGCCAALVFTVSPLIGFLSILLLVGARHAQIRLMEDDPLSGA